ncbi:MAG: adenylate/guanylate cyclase domain-containing protein, partial [Alphaproteobacteria bacterium]
LPTSRLFSVDILHQLPTLEAEVGYILTPNLVNLNSLGTQAIVFLLVAGCLALAVSRFRALMLSHAKAERERSNLARHFSPNMVEELSQMDEPLGTARSQTVAILFADIVGFTRLAETQSPEKVLALLRQVLGLMARQVFRHNATLDKYLGDGIMATFGTPHSNGHEAEDALGCARDTLADIAALNQSRESQGEVPVEIGIGVHIGPVVLGDVGDESRLEFAVVGDTVNVASRFERLTRELGVQLVVSGDVISALGDGAQELAAGLDHGALQRVRGRDEPVPVWTM